MKIKTGLIVLALVITLLGVLTIEKTLFGLHEYNCSCVNSNAETAALIVCWENCEGYPWNLLNCEDARLRYYESYCDGTDCVTPITLICKSGKYMTASTSMSCFQDCEGMWVKNSKEKTPEMKNETDQPVITVKTSPSE